MYPLVPADLVPVRRHRTIRGLRNLTVPGNLSGGRPAPSRRLPSEACNWQINLGHSFLYKTSSRISSLSERSVRPIASSSSVGEKHHQL